MANFFAGAVRAAGGNDGEGNRPQNPHDQKRHAQGHQGRRGLVLPQHQGLVHLPRVHEQPRVRRPLARLSQAQLPILRDGTSGWKPGQTIPDPDRDPEPSAKNWRKLSTFSFLLLLCCYYFCHFRISMLLQSFGKCEKKDSG